MAHQPAVKHRRIGQRSRAYRASATARDIRNLIDANPEWGVSNFGQTPYVDAQNGQTYQMYEMTRDGYSMLVMGFIGNLSARSG
ncbi:Rha family transcriptional regulator [Paracoccus sp. MC1862]|uniref:Rha family transcriptional regulator n=1 Tax=Paracoccus sp. MC1862 TaxID=2760307 RepID=UPI001601ACA2|nr:Rha family transcriptional regulator [Paracoccus sp. MC1862]MBB1498787.1 Rha family transcriptional regulator [Paracoccus sp. MC1862]QQO43807.1 Rha family transcriptional regulator [Paracoccus sp. MC1862]